MGVVSPMRTTLLAVTALALLTALPSGALAAAPADAGPPGGAGGGHGNATAAEARARHEALVAARQVAVDAFHANRSAILEQYHAAMAAIRASFQENKTAVLAECRGVVRGGDAPEAERGNPSGMADLNQTERLAFARCVRDGLAPLREQARADLRGAREDALGELRAAAKAAVAQFRSDRARVDGGA